MRMGRNLKTRIFFYYSFLIFLLIALIGMITFFYFRHNIRENTINNMFAVASSVSEQLNLQVQEMDRISYSVILDTYILQSLMRISGYDHETVKQDVYYDASRKISDNLFFIAQPFPDIYMLGVCNDQDMYFNNLKSVRESDQVRKQIFNQDKLQNLRANAGFFIRGSHYNEWVESDKEAVFSLLRTIKYSRGEIGFVEVQKQYSVISEIFEKASVSSAHLTIVDQRGNIVFPFGKDMTQEASFYADWYSNYKNQEIIHDKEIARVFNQESSSWDIVLRHYSDYTKWTVLYSLPEKSFLEPVYNFLKIIVLVAIIGFIISFSGAYLIAAHIYIPLRKLKKKVESFSYDSFSNLGETGSLWDLGDADAEILLLNNTFDSMATRLKQSVDETILTKSQIQKAYYKILQSQINPHFLHNTISVISIMARQIGAGDIVDMCGRLSRMLKYTVDIDRENVALREELDNVANYLGILKFRHEQRLEYKIDIDSDMFDITVPKMILQPFVENSIKHGLYGRSKVMLISITGETNEDGWVINITDNGRGFSERDLLALRTFIEEQNDDISKISGIARQINGVGIINTFLRLKSFFGSDLLFKIGNNSTGGGYILISAPHDS